MSPQSEPPTEGAREPAGPLKSEARNLGFLRCGVAAAGRSPHADRYLEWLDAGRQGTMHYLTRNVARRLDPRVTLPGARSVIVVSLPYPDDVGFPPSRDRGKISRYARGRDYHKVLGHRLRRLAEHVREGDRWHTWYSVDTGPLLERDWAEAAGIGWIGKNALVLDREVGSWFFLGVIVTDRPYATDPPATDHCGTCRACLDACPTDAFVGARSVDARRCISYLTIEHRGDLDPELATQLGGWIFGCDICQEVCPFNTRSGRTSPPTPTDFEPRALLDHLPTIAALDRAAFLEAYAGTPVTRARVEGLTRNARAVQARPEGER